MIMKTFEVTMLEPLSELEFYVWEKDLCDKGWDTVMAQSGRILLIETHVDIEDIISMLAEHDLAQDVGLIKEIITYEPELEETQYLVTFESE